MGLILIEFVSLIVQSISTGALIAVTLRIAKTDKQITDNTKEFNMIRTIIDFQVKLSDAILLENELRHNYEASDLDKLKQRIAYL